MADSLALTGPPGSGWWWSAALTVGGGLVLLWAALLVALWVVSRGRDPVSLREAVRLLPDVLRLVRRLAADPDVPRGVRVRLVLLLGYLLLPVDLVPDVVPVLGYADDAVVVALVLRAVVRRAGPGTLDRHWPGTAAGLVTLYALVGVVPPDPADPPGPGGRGGGPGGPGPDDGRPGPPTS